MNLTTSSDLNRNPWQQIKSRYVVGIAGLSLALGVAIGGVGALTFSKPATEDRLARAQVEAPMFANAADAEHASRSLVAMTELTQVKTPASREAQLVIDGAAASWGDYAAVLPSEIARRQVAQPMFGTAADADFAGRAVVPESAFR